MVSVQEEEEQALVQPGQDSREFDSLYQERFAQAVGTKTEEVVPVIDQHPLGEDKWMDLKEQAQDLLPFKTGNSGRVTPNCTPEKTGPFDLVVRRLGRMNLFKKKKA